MPCGGCSAIHPRTCSASTPRRAADRPRDLRPVRLADFGAVQANIGETGEGFVAMTFSEVEADPAPDTDFALLREGWATVTVLRAPREAGDAASPRLDDARARPRSTSRACPRFVHPPPVGWVGDAPVKFDCRNGRRSRRRPGGAAWADLTSVMTLTYPAQP